MAKPTTTFTWALGPGAFPVNQPVLARRQTGWDAGEMPPAREMNWLLQSTGDWLTYLNSTLLDVTTDIIGGGTVTSNGYRIGSAQLFEEERSAGLGTTTVRLTADSFIARLRAEIMHAGSYTFEDGDGTFNSGALSLDQVRTPVNPAPHAIQAWEAQGAGGGKVFVAQGGLLVNATPAETTAAGVGLDEGINLGNVLKAWAKVRIVRSGGVVTSCTLEGVAYNVASVLYDSPSGTIRVTLTDNTGGLVQGMLDHNAQHTGTVNNTAHPLSTQAAWLSGPGRVDITLRAQNTATTTWYEFNTATGTSGFSDMTVDVTVRVY